MFKYKHNNSNYTQLEEYTLSIISEGTGRLKDPPFPVQPWIVLDFSDSRDMDMIF